MNLTTTVNGETVIQEIEPGLRLIDFLRENLNLIGTKEGCGEGECGACTVLLDGVPVNSCLILAAQVHGREVTTIEGLTKDPAAQKLIETFCSEGAIQCGFCAPGLIVAAVPLVREKSIPTDAKIRQAISGNLCRCTGYSKVIAAIRKAAGGEK